MIKAFQKILIAGLCCLCGWSAQAQDIELNEPLVIRIIFSDCLAFIQYDATPFDGLDLLPITEDGLESLPTGLRESPGVKMRHLLSSRYIAAWGADDTVRYCVVMTNAGSDQPMQLGVTTDGFLDRMTERTAKIGLTDTLLSPPLSPLGTNTWEEPGFEPLVGRRITILPTAESAEGAIMDIGIINVAAGPNRFKQRKSP